MQCIFGFSDRSFFFCLFFKVLGIGMTTETEITGGDIVAEAETDMTMTGLEDGTGTGIVTVAGVVAEAVAEVLIIAGNADEGDLMMMIRVEVGLLTGSDTHTCTHNNILTFRFFLSFSLSVKGMHFVSLVSGYQILLKMSFKLTKHSFNIE